MSILENILGKVKAPLRDFSGGNSPVVEDFNNSVPDVASGHTAQGLNGQSLAEPIPNYIPAEGERVFDAGTNAQIVLGRDRPSNLASGYGGQGATGAGSIDLVVGRRPLNGETNVDPNFITDAARIHISQTTDMDKNFNLPAGSSGRIDARSGVGIKADDVRIIGRRSVKIITEGRGTNNSKDGRLRTTVGIDLIAGPGTSDMGIQGPELSGDGIVNPSLQPIPKGLQLVDALFDAMGLMDDLAAIVATNTNAIHQNATNIASHAHPVFVGPIPGIATPSPTAGAMGLATKTNLWIRASAPMYAHRVNTQTYRANYLRPVGDGWICSRYNNTN